MYYTECLGYYLRVSRRLSSKSKNSCVKRGEKKICSCSLWHLTVVLNLRQMKQKTKVFHIFMYIQRLKPLTHLLIQKSLHQFHTVHYMNKFRHICTVLYCDKCHTANEKQSLKYNDFSDSSATSKLLIINVFQVTKWI